MYQLPKLLTAQVLIYLQKSRTDDPGLTVEEVLAKHEQMLNDEKYSIQKKSSN